MFGKKSVCLLKMQFIGKCLFGVNDSALRCIIELDFLSKGLGFQADVHSRSGSTRFKKALTQDLNAELSCLRFKRFKRILGLVGVNEIT